MSVVFQYLFLLHTPLWLSLCLAAAVLALLWRQHMMYRTLEQHSRFIGYMDDWADQADERLDRVDWSNRRQTPANDQRSAVNWQRTA